MTTNGQDFLSTPHLKDHDNQQLLLHASNQGLKSTLTWKIKGHLQNSLATFAILECLRLTGLHEANCLNNRCHILIEVHNDIISYLYIEL